MTLRITFHDIAVDGTTCRQGGRRGTLVGARAWIEPRSTLLTRLTTDPLQQGRSIIPLLRGVADDMSVLSIIGLNYAFATPVATHERTRARHFIELLDSLVQTAEAAIPNPTDLTVSTGSFSAT